MVKNQRRSSVAKTLTGLAALVAVIVPMATQADTPVSDNATTDVEAKELKPEITKEILAKVSSKRKATGIHIQDNVLRFVKMKRLGAGLFPLMEEELVISFNKNEEAKLREIEALLGEGEHLHAPGGKYYKLV